MLLFAFVYKDDTQRIISQLLCSNIFVLPSPWLMLLSTLSSFKSLWMDQKWNQFIFSSLAFEGRYFMLDMKEVICLLPAVYSLEWHLKMLSKPQVRAHLMGGKLDTGSLSPADGGKLCSLREGRRQRICIPWHWWCRQRPPPPPHFPLSLNLSLQ